MQSSINKNLIALQNVVIDDFARATLGGTWNIANVGGSSATIVSNDLNLSGGTGLTTEYIYYQNYATCIENFTINVPFKCTEKSTTSFGFGIGVRGRTNAGSGSRSLFVSIILSTGINSGKCFLYEQTGSSAAVNVSSSNAIAFAVNDEMQLVITRDKFVITYTITNFTNPSTVSTSYTSPMTFGIVDFPNATGWYGIYIFGGTQSLHDFTVYSPIPSNLWMGFVGDSITLGLFATSVPQRFPELVMGNYIGKYFAVMGGGGDDSGAVLTRLGEILAINPKYCLLRIGANDITYGVSSGTYQANITSIVNILNSAGIRVIICNASPQNVTNMTTLNTFLATFYPSYIVIDNFTPLLGTGTGLNPAYDAGDGVHLNPAGYQVIASTIQASFISNNIY